MTQIDHPLVQTLGEITSQDPKRIKLGEERLTEWVRQPGYHLSLLEIGYSSHLPLNIRLSSLLLLKNNIDKYWRKTSLNPISVEEKNAIKQNLLNFFWESQTQLQTQNSVIIGKIARLDFPTEWSNLMPELCQKIQEINQNSNNDNLENLRVLGRILHTVNSVVKSLSSKTLALSRRQFEEASPPLLQLISLIYTQKFTQLKNQLENSQLEGVHELINISHYCLKISRRLLVYGFKLPFSTDICQELVGVYLDHFSLVYGYIKSLPNEYQFRDPLIKLLILIGKIYLELQSHHAIELANHSKFLPLMQMYWQVLQDLINNESDQLEKLIIQALTLYKNTIFNYYYMIGEKEQPTEELLRARKVINEDLLNDGFLFGLVELVMTRYMTLRPSSDLKGWEEDPQLWLLDEATDPWEFKSRACAEKVIVSTVARDKARIGPFLAQLVQKFSGLANTLEELLIKDSVYNACGLASHELFDYLDFDTWFKERLVTEIQQQSPGHHVLKFRIAWLIGRWVGVKLPKETRPLVYETLLHLMQPSNDDGPSTIVQITAISALRDCVDDWDFEPSRFLPYLAQVLPLLSQAIAQVDEIELKMKVVNCLSIIIERMEQHIAPFTPSITELLPNLWQLEGEGENLLKSSIVTMVTKLVKSIKQDPVGLLPIISEIVRHSTDLNNEAHIYLLEDGVDLWAATLINTGSLTPILIDLLPCAIPLLSIASEVLAKVLLVVESYFLLNTTKVVEAAGVPLLETFSASLTEVRPDACAMICRVIETAMTLTNNSAQIQQLFIQSGLLQRLLDLTLSTEEPPSNQTKYLLLISRFIIWDSSNFLNYLINYWQQQTPQLIDKFIEIWIDRIDVMIDTRHRKLNSLALASLLQTPPNTPELTTLTALVYAKLPDFMTVWTSCLAEVSEFESGDAMVYHSEYSSQKVEQLGETEIDGTLEEDRRNIIPEADIVFNTNLKLTIWHSLERAQLHSPQLVQEYLNKVDQLVIDQIKP